MTVREHTVVVYNTNQFADPAGQERSVLNLMAVDGVDAILLVECFHVNAHKLAHRVDGWVAHQERSSNDQANVAILYRRELGARRLGYRLASPRVRGHKLRARHIAFARFPFGTLAVTHRAPERDDELWPTEDAAVRRFTWFRRHVLVGMDDNAPRPAQQRQLRRATRLAWHGHGLMGALTKGFTVTHVHYLTDVATTSDHPAVALTIRRSR